MEQERVCFSGHRMIPDDPELAQRLRASVMEQIENGSRIFIAGGAQGFDTLAAETVLSLKVQNPHIRLHLALPYPAQASSWPKYAQERYERIKQQADVVYYMAAEYARGCIHRRNRFLVDHSDVCICYLNHDSGGTLFTVKYARKQGLRVLNLAPGAAP